MARNSVVAWIGVTDRMPDIGEKVLVQDTSGEISMATMGKFFFESDSLSASSVSEVAYWQPLPQPYSP